MQEAVNSQIVIAPQEGHEEHPESMRPRVYLTVVHEDGEHVDYVRHYEVLQTGWVIQRNSLPEGQFDYLHFMAPNLKHFRLAKAEHPVTAYWAGTTTPVSASVGLSIPTLELR
jgi:hypothetical protein